MDTDNLDAEIAALKALALEGRVQEALEGLLNLEKQKRLAEDVASTTACCSAVLDVCFQGRDWKLLNEQIVLLSKRRGQLKQAVQNFVRQAIGYLDKTPDKATKVELIKTLQAVTEGKIYVEIERARLTKKLAAIKEAEGKVDEAAEILQEVAVETFGAMAKSEKVAFILEQARLCLDKGDYVRAQILAKKISPKAFVDRRGTTGDIGIEGTTIEAPDEGIPSLEQLKLEYYLTMIRYHAHFNNYLEICRAFKAMYESEAVSNDVEKWKSLLKKICWFVVLAPSHSTEGASSSDQLTLLNSTHQDKNLIELPAHKQMLKQFMNKELMNWSVFENEYHEVMAEEPEIFGGELGMQRLKDLRLRVTEHNILVVAHYYTRITMTRLSELLDLPADETEKELSNMVVQKAVYAKIDRPAGVARFGSPQRPDHVLNRWSTSIARLLDLVEKSCQQIQKESMQYKVPIGSA
ncbi:unnamed protein product [Ostreobium quekettii]|uniref:PCI domain-containing protein n=1 Tax=Ostreobium quekettii TaxID=121088 RepID=A0A8S1ITV4_9CHLO|nr:unnamed protein product [Ostreobium quekettii]